MTQAKIINTNPLQLAAELLVEQIKTPYNFFDGIIDILEVTFNQEERVERDEEYSPHSMFIFFSRAVGLCWLESQKKPVAGVLAGLERFMGSTEDNAKDFSESVHLAHEAVTWDQVDCPAGAEHVGRKLAFLSCMRSVAAYLQARELELATKETIS